MTARGINPIVVQEADDTTNYTTLDDNYATSPGTSDAYDQEGGYGGYYGNEETDYPGYPGYDYNNPTPGSDQVPEDLYNPVVDDEFSVGQPNTLPPIGLDNTGGNHGNQGGNQSNTEGDADDAPPADDGGHKKKKKSKKVYEREKK